MSQIKEGSKKSKASSLLESLLYRLLKYLPGTKYAFEEGPVLCFFFPSCNLLHRCFLNSLCLFTTELKIP